MSLIPSVFIFTGSQSLSAGWRLGRDRGWRILMGLPVGSFHAAYVDGLAGRSPTGNYDAFSGLVVQGRDDYESYAEDLREQLMLFEQRFGFKIDAGVGGYHDLPRWERAAGNGTLQDTIWKCRRVLLADDYPPNLGRPARPLVRCMVLDGAGGIRPTLGNIAAACCMVERKWWPISCESRADYGSLFMDRAANGWPQYTQYATAKITFGLWQSLRANGHTDHTILPDAQVWTETERSAWEGLGIRVALAPEQVRDLRNPA